MWISRLFGSKKAKMGEAQQQHASGSTSDYAAKCVTANYKEQHESRSWASDPAFRRVLDPLNAGNNARATKEARALTKRFPDFADVYVWWAEALLRDHKYDEARGVLRDALCKCRQKYPLLNLMGKVEWKSGSLSEAVYWWVQGLMCQETLERFGGETGAYLYLYHVADALGLSGLATHLQQRVDFIVPGKIRLAPDAVACLRRLVQASDTTEVRKALRMVEERYFALQAQAGGLEREDEVAHLIRVAQDESAGYDVREDAILRLGEIGDRRAMEPLMQIYRTELHFIRLSAAEAVDKIRAREATGRKELEA